MQGKWKALDVKENEEFQTSDILLPFTEQYRNYFGSHWK